jgi:uncharacterized membrane protein YhaH (DUF805 family)
MSQAATYNVVITGNITGDRERAITGLAKLFKKSELHVEGLLIKAPVAIKKRVDKATADKYQRAIEQFGVEVQLEENKSALHEQWSLEPIENEAPKSTSGGRASFEAKEEAAVERVILPAKKNQPESHQTEQTASDNLYAAPQSEVLDDEDYHEVSMSLSEIYFSLNGRINRKTYWLNYVLASIGFFIVLTLLAVLLQEVGAILFLIAMIPFIWASIAVSVKRLHDVNLSGWWYLFPVIPNIIAQLMLFSGSSEGLHLLFSGIAGLANLALLILNGFIPGTKGRNDYGYPQAS